MDNNSSIKAKAVEIIRTYMGASTAQSYSNFYENQKDETVLASIAELLDEYVGSSRAKEILNKYGLVKKIST